MVAIDVGDDGESSEGRGSSGGALQRQLDRARLRRVSDEIPAKEGAIGEGNGSVRFRGERGVEWCEQ